MKVGRGKKKALKTILHSLSGAVHPGHLLAVMGPTGVSSPHSTSCLVHPPPHMHLMPCAVRWYHHFAEFLLMKKSLCFSSSFRFPNRVCIHNDIDLLVVAIVYLKYMRSSPFVYKRLDPHATIPFSRNRIICTTLVAAVKQRSFKFSDDGQAPLRTLHFRLCCGR